MALFSRSKVVVGLDIGSATVKLVELAGELALLPTSTGERDVARRGGLRFEFGDDLHGPHLGRSRKGAGGKSRRPPVNFTVQLRNKTGMSNSDQLSDLNWYIIFICWIVASISTLGSLFFGEIMAHALFAA